MIVNELFDKVVDYVIKKFYRNTPFERDELINIGYIGYTKAVKNFDSEKYERMFTNYAEMYIRQEINVALKKFNNDSHTQMEPEFLDTFNAVDADKLENEMELEMFERNLKVLTPNEKLVISKHIFQDSTFMEIAGELGVSKQRVHQLKNSAITKLKRFYNE